jgi:hypothetical protein
MWHAIRAGKVERVLALRHKDAPAAWRAIVDESEDLLTSGVLERLGYLPRANAMEVLLRAAEVRELRWLPLPESVDESFAWPRIDDGDSWIEPDWVWVTASYLVVFEAKWGRGIVPSESQLEGQQRMCAERWPRKRLLHVALVQSGNVVFPPGSNALVVTWSALRSSISNQLERSQDAAEHRVLIDARGMLDARGVAAPHIATLPAIEVRGMFDGLLLPTLPPDVLGALPPINIDDRAIALSW